MAKVKSKKAAPTNKGEDRASTEMVMLLIVTLGLAVTTIMAYGR